MATWLRRAVGFGRGKAFQRLVVFDRWALWRWATRLGEIQGLLFPHRPFASVSEMAIDCELVRFPFYFVLDRQQPFVFIFQFFLT